MEKTGFVYHIRCHVSEKSYVGMTIKPINERWKQHVREAKRNNPYPLYCAIRKHGEESFTIETLEETTIESLPDVERKWISQLQTTTSGYNLKPGGNGTNGTPPGEVREKIAESLRGRVLSDETKRKISDSLRGRKPTYETREKIRKSLARPECKAARIKARTGKLHTEETKNVISNCSIHMWENPDFKEKMSAMRTGSLNSRAILDEDKVKQIRIAWQAADKDQRGSLKRFCDLWATELGVNPPVVFRVVMGYSWKHVSIDDTTGDS